MIDNLLECYHRQQVHNECPKYEDDVESLMERLVTTSKVLILMRCIDDILCTLYKLNNFRRETICMFHCLRHQSQCKIVEVSRVLILNNSVLEIFNERDQKRQTMG